MVKTIEKLDTPKRLTGSEWNARKSVYQFDPSTAVDMDMAPLIHKINELVEEVNQLRGKVRSLITWVQDEELYKSPTSRHLDIRSPGQVD